MLGNCEELESVVLPESLVTIDRGVFFNCTALTKITIPSGVASIGELALWNAINMTDIYNLSSTPQQITNIHHNPSQITLHVPAESVEAYKQAPVWKEMRIVPIRDENNAI